MVRTNIQLTTQQHTALKRAARKNDISISEAVRRAVDYHYLRQSAPIHKTTRNTKPKNAGDFLLKLAHQAEKEGWKGPKDLSNNMDKYLYGDNIERKTSTKPIPPEQS